MRRETSNPGSQLPLLVGDNAWWPGNRREEYTSVGEQGEFGVLSIWLWTMTHI